MTSTNVCKIGDVVRIEECQPISKRKTWLVVERNGQLRPTARGAPMRLRGAGLRRRR